MHSNPSLLGQFFTRIKGSQEDLATEGLNYILNHSITAKKGLASIIRNQTGIELPELIFRTQVVGEGQERPDIVGLTEMGKELIIIEAKFWSSLTDKQPVTYLERLIEDNSILMFICPSLRIRTLWQEIKIRLSNAYIVNDNSHLAYYANKTIFIQSWGEVLQTLRSFLVQNNESQFVSDIDQIIGLCNVIDKNTFLPLSNEDLSPSVPRRISSYYDLVDKVMDEIRKHIPIDLTGLKATAQRTGYCRYFKYNDLGLSLQLNFDFWQKELDTPFWITFQRATTKYWTLDDELKQKVRLSGKQFYYNNYRIPHYGLLPPRNVTENEVISHLSKEAIAIIHYMAD